MTNREWINSLNNEQFANFITSDGFQRLKLSFTDSRLGLIDWLNQNAHGFEPTTKQDYLQMIYDIAIDYDGARNAQELFSLVDELKELAKKGIECEN